MVKRFHTSNLLPCIRAYDLPYNEKQENETIEP